VVEEIFRGMTEVNLMVTESRRLVARRSGERDFAEVALSHQEESQLRRHRKDPAGVEFVAPAFAQNVGGVQGAGSLEGYLRNSDMYQSPHTALARSKRELLTTAVALDALMRGDTLDLVEILVRRFQSLTVHCNHLIRNGGKTSGPKDWEESAELESLTTAHETPTVLRSERRLAQKTIGARK
jgi:hypothetical protein